MSKLAYTSRPVNACQICGSKGLKSMLFVGFIPPVNTMPDVGSRPVEQPAYPLELLRCSRCTLVQIGLEVNPEILFPPEYPYLSGSTRILRENFAELYRESSRMLGLQAKDLVVDIGSNDGTLLGNYRDGGHRVLGVEPSQAGKLAIKRGVPTEIAFFGKETARRLRKKHGPAKVMTAANVFAHIGDIHSVVDGIVSWLDKDGVFISESHYLLGLLKTVQYDTIYHEHLRHYSLRSLSFLLAQHGLEVFHAKKIPTHGGSIRVYAARKGSRKIQGSVRRILGEEKAFGLDSGRAFQVFAQRVVASKWKLHALLGKLKSRGARIVGIGAPSRASTLINYVGLDDRMIDAVMEVKTSHKLNKYIPGTRIPVVDEAVLYRDQPEYAMLLSWHISRELMGNLRKNGYRGKFVIPLPVPTIANPA